VAVVGAVADGAVAARAEARRPGGIVVPFAAPGDGRATPAPAATGTRPRPATEGGAAAMAARLGVPLLDAAALAASAERLHRIPLPDGRTVPLIEIGRGLHGPIVAVPAEPARLPALAALLAARPELRRRIRLVEPDVLAAALAQASRPADLPAGSAADRPTARRPPTPAHVGALGALAVARVLAALRRRGGALSADRVVAPAQAAAGRVAVAGLAVALFLAPSAVVGLLGAAAMAAFLGLAVLRAAAAGSTAAAFAPQRRPLAEAALPVYTVLVPLFREARVVPRLLAGLKALDYPADRLDVKLLVEAGDGPTRAAVETYAAGTPFEILVIPAVGPLTKPKALDVGLAAARGSLVTIYDAEDRPEPRQLRDAAETFAAAGDDLACVQARLAIDHPNDTWLTRMFAIEYAMLFDRLLPWLASTGLPFLLGGTSNHFRRGALLAVGAWDPWNVTEDADLAVRLARAGLRSTVIASTTFEEAPLSFTAWLRQRSRWYKGWMQTWLVHARDPAGLWRGCGPAAFLLLQLQLLGTLVAVMAHPLCIGLVAAHLTGALSLGGSGSLIDGLRTGAVLVSLVGGYAAAAVLAVVAIGSRRLGLRRAILLTLPAYWLILSVALVRALVELRRRPHHWAKTEHGLAVRPPVPPAG